MRQQTSKFLKTIWQDESAQGATEYILILVVIVAAALAFGRKFQPAVEGIVDQFTGSLTSFTTKFKVD